MRYLKILGLLAVAAMAFASTASATIFTSEESLYTGPIQATSTNWQLDGAFVTIECTHSVIEGDIEAHGSGGNVVGKVTYWTFEGCNYATEAVFRGSYAVNGNNTVFSGGATIRAFTSVGTCGFTTNLTDIGSLTESSQTGGRAVLDHNSSKIPRTEGNFLCGTSGTLTGSYEVITPEDLDVD